jgi:hypothetical protein
MIENEVMRVERVPFMWKVLIFRIAQAERRERILSDWEENVFGFHLRASEKPNHHRAIPSQRYV